MSTFERGSIYPVTLFIVLAIFSESQARPFEFGKISADQMDLKYYREKYPDDYAVMIGDFGNCRFVSDQRSNLFLFQLERTYRIMILDPRGVSLGDVSIPYVSASDTPEKIRRFRANVYNLKGGRVVRQRIRHKDGAAEKIRGTHYEKKYSLPDIQPGTVFEVRYTLVSQLLHELRPWHFQYSYPVEHSEFGIRIPSVFRYRNFYRGFISLEESSSHSEIERFSFSRADNERDIVRFNTSYFKWKATDVPAFRIEPFTDNYQNYLASMHFEYVGVQWPHIPHEIFKDTWETAIKHLYQDNNFGGYLTSAKTLVSSDIPFEPADEDLNTILNHSLETIRNQVEWNSRSTIRAFRPPDDVLSSGKGNSAEINLLLCAMLQSKGIDAYPVLLRTRESGAVFLDNPTWKFNHLMVGVKDENQKVILMDASQRRLPAGYIPNFAINGHGRLIWKEGSEWVPLENPGMFHEKRTYDLVFNPDGSLSGAFNFRYYGKGKILLDNRVYSSGNESVFEEIGEELKASHISPALEISGSSAEPAIISGEIEFDNFVASAGDEIFLQAMLFETITSHGFQLDKREYPVFFDRKSLKEIEINLKLPQGVVVDELPESQIISFGNYLIYEYKSSWEDGMLTLSAKKLIGIHFIDSMYYPSIREFFSNVVEKNRESIVLKKL